MGSLVYVLKYVLAVGLPVVVLMVIIKSWLYFKYRGWSNGQR